MFAIDTTSAEIDPILDAWLPNKIVMADLKGDRLKGLMCTTITRLAGTSKLLDGVRCTWPAAYEVRLATCLISLK